jgi:hypothetical protein
VCIWQPAFFLGKRIRFEGSLISQNHGLWRRAIFVSSISSSPEPIHHWVSEHRSFCNRGVNSVILQSGAKTDGPLSRCGSKQVGNAMWSPLRRYIDRPGATTTIRHFHDCTRRMRKGISENVLFTVDYRRSQHYPSITPFIFYSFKHVRSQPYVGVVMRKRMVGFKLSQPIPDT